MKINSFLSKNDIQHTSIIHPYFASLEEGLTFCEDNTIPYPRNMVFENKGQVIMVSLCDKDKNIDTGALKKELELTWKMSHTKAETLENVLGVMSGAVSPLGLCLDSAKEVIWVYDKDFKNHPKVWFHPNKPDETYILLQEDFQKFVTEISGMIQKVIEMEIPLKD